MAGFTMFYKDLIKYYPDEWNDVMTHYPLFSEEYREQLNNKIKNALYFREISYETPELFLNRLASFLELRMPSYNFLYQSNLIKIEPLLRLRIIESFNKNLSNNAETKGNTQRGLDTVNSGKIERENIGSNINNLESNDENESLGTSSSDSINNSSSKGKSKTTHSDFPQGNIGTVGDSGYFSTQDVNETENSENSNNSDSSQNTQKSNAKSKQSQVGSNENLENVKNENTQNITENQDAKSNTKFNELEDHVLVREGLSNFTDAEMLEKYLEVKGKLANIDEMLINELKKEMTINVFNGF